jgi:hypothetical protein
LRSSRFGAHRCPRQPEPAIGSRQKPGAFVAKEFLHGGAGGSNTLSLRASTNHCLMMGSPTTSSVTSRRSSSSVAAHHVNFPDYGDDELLAVTELIPADINYKFSH